AADRAAGRVGRHALAAAGTAAGVFESHGPDARREASTGAKSRVDRDLDVALERARDRAAFGGALRCFLERRLIDAGHRAGHHDVRRLDTFARVEGDGRA